MANISHTMDIKVDAQQATVALTTFHETTKKLNSDVERFNNLLEKESENLRAFKNATDSVGATRLTETLKEQKDELKGLLQYYGKYTKGVKELNKEQDSLAKSISNLRIERSKANKQLRNEREMYDTVYAAEQRYARAIGKIHKSYIQTSRDVKAYSMHVKNLSRAFSDGKISVASYASSLDAMKMTYKGSTTDINAFTNALLGEEKKLQSGAITKKQYTANIKELSEQYKKITITEKKYQELLDKQAVKLSKATGQFGKMGKVLDNFSQKTKNAVRKMAGLNVEVEKTPGRFKRASASATNYVKSLFTIKGAVQLLHATWKIFFAYHAAVTFGRIITDLARTGEMVELLRKKIAYFTNESDGFGKMASLAFKVGINLTSLGKVITRFSVATKGAYDVDTMNRWAEGLLKAGRAVGTTNQELQSGLIQITQAMSAGRLMGDEFRSVSENIPMLRQALDEIFDEKLGTARNSLKKLAADGKITVDVLVEAFERLNEKVKDIPGTTDTIDAAFERIKVGFSLLIDRLTAGSGMIKGFLNGVADGLMFLNNSFRNTHETINLSEEDISRFGVAAEKVVEIVDTKAGFLGKFAIRLTGIKDGFSAASQSTEYFSQQLGIVTNDTTSASKAFSIFSDLMITKVGVGLIGTVGKLTGVTFFLKKFMDLLGKSKKIKEFTQAMSVGTENAGYFNGAIIVLTNSIKALFFWLGKHPLIAAATAAGLLAAGIYKYTKDLSKAEKAQKSYNETLKESIGLFKEQYALSTKSMSKPDLEIELSQQENILGSANESIDQLKSKYAELFIEISRLEKNLSNTRKRGVYYRNLKESISKAKEEMSLLNDVIKKLNLNALQSEQAIRILNERLKVIDVKNAKDALQAFMDKKSEYLDKRTKDEQNYDAYIKEMKYLEDLRNTLEKAGLWTEELSKTHEKLAVSMHKHIVLGKDFVDSVDNATKAKMKYQQELINIAKAVKLNLYTEKEADKYRGLALKKYEKSIGVMKELGGANDKDNERKKEEIALLGKITSANEKYFNVIKDIKDERDDTADSTLRLIEAQKALMEVYVLGRMHLFEYVEQLKILDELYETLRVKELEEQFNGLNLQIKDSNKLLKDLGEALKKDIVTNRQYSATMYEIKKSMLVNIAAAEDLGLSIIDITLSFDQFLEDSGKNFESLFKDVFAGTEDAFESFTERMERLFTDMLADMAYQAIMNPIIVTLQESVIGAGYGSAAQGGTQISGTSLTSMANNLPKSAGELFSGGGETSWENFKNLFAGRPVGATQPIAAGATTEAANFMSAPFDSISASGIASSPTYGLSNATNVLGSSFLGGYVAGQVGGWGGVASGAATGIGATALSGGIFGSAAAPGLIGGGSFMTGASTALAGLGPVGWAALAVSIIMSSGVLNGNSDITPDLSLYNTSKRKSEIIAQDTEEGETDIQFLAAGRYGGFGIMTQHDMFESQEDATKYYEYVSDKLNALDDAIFMAVDSETNDAIERAMSGNWFDPQKWEEAGEFDIEQVLEKRFDRMFDAMNNPLENAYEHLRDLGLAYDEATTAAIIYDNAIEETQKLLDDMWDNHMGFLKDVGKEGENFATTAIRLAGQLQTMNIYMDAFGEELFDLTAESADSVDRLADLAGGFDNLISKMDFFYKNFFEEQDQFAFAMAKGEEAISNFSEEWDLDFLTKESLKDLALAQDLNTDSGRKLYNALMNIAPVVNDYYGAIDALTEKQKQLNEEILNAGNALQDMHIELMDGNVEINNAIRNIEQINEKYGFSGDEAYTTSVELANLIYTLDETDESVRAAIPNLESLTDSIKYLEKIAEEATKAIEDNINSITGSSGNAEIDALQAEIDALEKKKSMSEDTATASQSAYDSDMDRYEAAIEANKTIMEFLDSLKISDLNNQSPYDQMMEASKLFYGAVQDNDADKATEYAGDYLGFAQQYYASTTDYSKIFDDVTKTLEGMITDPGTPPADPSNGLTNGNYDDGIDAQISELQTQIDHLINIDKNQQKLTETIIKMAEYSVAKGVEFKDAIVYQLGLNDTTLTELLVDSELGTANLADLLNVTQTDVVTWIASIGEDIWAADAELGKQLYSVFKDFGRDISGLQTETWNMLISLTGSITRLAELLGQDTSNIINNATMASAERGGTIDTYSNLYADSDVTSQEVKTIEDWLVSMVTSSNYSTTDLASLWSNVSGVDTNTDTIDSVIKYLFPEITDDSLSTYNNQSTAYVPTTTSTIENPAQALLDIFGTNSYALGTSYVPNNMLAGIHKGEMIIDPETSAQLRNYGIKVSNVQSNAEIINELRELKEELRQVKEINATGFRHTIQHNKRVADSAEEQNDRERLKD